MAEKWCRKLLTTTSENRYRAQAYYNLSLIYEKRKQPEIAQRYLFISYYLRPHIIVEKALLKNDPSQILPQKIPATHPFESLETHPLQQKLYTPAFAQLSAEEVIRSLFPAVEPELLQERLFVNQHYALISEVNYILEGIPDDSVSGDKTVLFLVRVNEQWELLAARSSHKCHLGRGISDWNTQPCL